MRAAFIVPGVLLALVASGCSFTFDSSAPALPFINTEPDTPSLPKLNTAPVNDEFFVTGVDDLAWLVLQQTDNSYRMVDLDGTMAPDIVTQEQYDAFYFTGSELYIVKNDASDMGGVDGGALQPVDAGVSDADGGASGPPDMALPSTVTLTIRHPGEQPGDKYTEPGGDAFLYPTNGDVAFVYIVADKRLPGYTLQRRDRPYTRIIPWPHGIDGDNPLAKGTFFWNGAATIFYDRDADGRLVAHDANDSIDIDLGVRKGSLAFGDANTIVTCNSDGLRAIASDGKSPERVLDPTPCNPAYYGVYNGFIYYDVGETLRKTSFKPGSDGTYTTIDLYDFGADQRILQVGQPEDTIMYSTTPARQYVHGAGDGWIRPPDGSADFKFMNRGSGIYWGTNRTQLYWLENSAQASGAGELMLLDMPAPATAGGSTMPLARNVRGYEIMSDGRVLCDDNHAFDGTQNRIVLVDPVRGHTQWVASSANGFTGIPGSNDFVVDIVSAATGHDVVRVTLPPAEPLAPPNQ